VHNGQNISVLCHTFEARRRVAPMTKAVILEDQPLTLANVSPSLAEKQLAFAVALAFLAAACLSTAELSNVQLRPIYAFVPVYGTAIFVNDVITAVLLFNLFAVLRSRALLAISSGYFFTALMVIPWTLTFPGVFAPAGLLGAGLQSSNWLYIFRYAAFPTFVIAYTLLKDADPPKRFWPGSPGTTILASVAISAMVVCVLTVIVIAGDPYSPRISIDPIHFSTVWLYLSGCLIVWNAAALILLWIRLRSVLDLWLMVVLCAYVVEIYLVSFPDLARFGGSWYAGRVFGFVSSILVLVVLLGENTALYAQVLDAVLAQRREREARLMTGDAVSASIAHEIKQPLTAVITSATAALNWLDHVEPNLNSVRNALQRVVTSGHNADSIVENIRTHFKVGARARTSLDIGDVIREALTVVRGKLQTHRIVVKADLTERLPQIKGEPVQLQQVLVNLITNAIDSMAEKDGERVLSIRSEIIHSGDVMVSVEDTGAGIEPGAVNRIFDPMFTTKAQGMGMGLSICRSIVEAHHGRLWAAADKCCGAVFHFTIPADSGRTF
jgi:signal transduction histidine kinase